MKLKNALLAILAVSGGAVVAQIPENFDAEALYIMVDSELDQENYQEVSINNSNTANDQLLIVRKGAEDKYTSLEVANSLKGYSNQVVTNYDGRYVLVSSGDDSVNGYSSFLTEKGVVRILDTKHGTILEEELSSKAGPIAINHLKGIVAVAAGAEANTVSLLIWKGRAVTNTIEVFLKGLVAADRISNLVWSPSGSYLAVTFEQSNKVAFYRLTNDAEGVSLELKGKPVACGVNPGVGVFSSDEEYFYVADQNKDYEKGSVASVKVDMVSGQHEFLQSIVANMGPEMIRISPDGKHIVTVNRRGAHLASSHKKKTRMTSISVFKTLKNGKLKPLGEYPFPAVYPSDIRFDKSGDMIAVVANRIAGDEEHGEVLFWDFTPNKKIQLKIRDERLEVPRGAHTISVQ